MSAAAHQTSGARPADLLLPRLESLRETGPGQWYARCPAHPDRRASLSVSENPDGRLLVNCFAGCAGAEVLAAVGLSLADLYPDGGKRREAGPIPQRERWDAWALLRQLGLELTAAHAAAEAISRGESLTESDRRRVRRAAIELGKAIALAGVENKTPR